MEIIDDEGRLFGTVNVIDALVVMLVLAVVIAGIVFLWSGPGEPAERYVTIDLGQQSEFVIDQIEEGDEIFYEGTSDNLTITDTYVYEDDGQPAMMVRARVDGTVEFDEARERDIFHFRGEPLRVGQSIDLETPEYETEGQLLEIGGGGADLGVDTTEVVIETTVSEAALAEIEVGDRYAVGEWTVAEIVSFEAFPVDGTAYHAYVGVELHTVEVRDRLRFGHQRISIGSSVNFVTETYALGGGILRIGDASVVTEMTPVLLTATVPSDVAEDVSVGDTYEVADKSLLRIESLTVYPTGNPTTKRLVIGAEALLRHDDDRHFFGNQPIRVGSTLPIVTDAYDLEAEVVRRGTMESRGDRTTKTITVELLNVHPTIADRLEPGLVERYGDEQTVEVLDVTTAPAEVVLESEDGDIFLREHPINKDVEMTLTVSVRETEAGAVYFRGEPLRSGETVTLELGQLTPIGVTVLDIE